MELFFMLMEEKYVAICLAYSCGSCQVLHAD